MRDPLDTNIISNVTKPAASESLIAWMSEQVDEDLFIASLTVAEIRRDVLEKPAGKQRDQLESWFGGPEGPQALFAGRVQHHHSSLHLAKPIPQAQVQPKNLVLSQCLAVRNRRPECVEVA